MTLAASGEGSEAKPGRFTRRGEDRACLEDEDEMESADAPPR
jgi:hypothetical protein